MKLLPDSNFIISMMTELFSEYPGLLIKMGHSGNIIWARTTRVANVLLPMNDGGIILIGNHYDNLAYEMGIMKGDSLGNGVGCWIQNFIPSFTPGLFPMDTVILYPDSEGIASHIQIPLDPTAFTFDTGCVYVSTNQLESSTDINVFPNPANNSINVSFANNNIDYMYIVDMLGVRQKFMTQSNSTSSINISGLSPGIYNLTIASDSHRYSRRFVKISNN
jgi:hypothetical protein